MMTVDVYAKDLLRKLNNAPKLAEAASDEMSHRACEILRDNAIKTLEERVTGKWPPGLHSIRDKNNWPIIKVGDKHELWCNSAHAAIVELGAPGRILYASDYGIKAFPIGMSQGLPPEFRSSITLQGGYGFFRSTLESPQIKGGIGTASKYILEKYMRML